MCIIKIIYTINKAMVNHSNIFSPGMNKDSVSLPEGNAAFSTLTCAMHLDSHKMTTHSISSTIYILCSSSLFLSYPFSGCYLFSIHSAAPKSQIYEVLIIIEVLHVYRRILSANASLNF